MESRKSQLQKQIIEALNFNDSDLYTLLKSQWAHRYGVESLEELKNLDLEQQNKKLNNMNSQKIDNSKEVDSDDEKSFLITDDDNQEKEMKTSEFESIKKKNDQSFKAELSQKVVSENDDIEEIKSLNENKKNPKINALIPLPPKPKYGYLRKWLIRK